jgi:5,10-methylenetetrahydromethanopterin reductase
MTTNGDIPIGFCFGSMGLPENIAALAALGEELGYAEMWLPEDYFFVGGIAGAAIALSATKRIPFGIGIASAVVRSPAVYAQEVATLSRAFPGRIWPGIGLGWPAWLDQMGIRPKAQLATVRECVNTLRSLLNGEEVSLDGKTFQLDRVVLVHPPTEPVPIYAGVMGPKMLGVAGETADGTLFGMSASAKYVTFARERIAEGAAKAGRDGHHRTPCLALFGIDKDSATAKAAIKPGLAFYLSILGRNGYTDVYGISDQIEDMMARGGVDTIEREMPDEWLEDLVIAGDPDECEAKIRAFLAAGADSVVLAPPAEVCKESLQMAGELVLPRFG